MATSNIYNFQEISVIFAMLIQSRLYNTVAVRYVFGERQRRLQEGRLLSYIMYHFLVARRSGQCVIVDVQVASHACYLREMQLVEIVIKTTPLMFQCN